MFLWWFQGGIEVDWFAQIYLITEAKFGDDKKRWLVNKIPWLDLVPFNCHVGCHNSLRVWVKAAYHTKDVSKAN